VEISAGSGNFFHFLPVFSVLKNDDQLMKGIVAIGKKLA
jgi:hypothetical protein